VIADAYFEERTSEENEYEKLEFRKRGILNPSFLSSALGEPKQTFNMEDLYPDIFSKAAVLMRSLIMNHPFIDGNKRTATMATIVFLEQNGYIVTAPDNKLYRLAMKIVNQKPTPTVNNIAKTLKKYCQLVEYKPRSKYEMYWEKVRKFLIQK